MAQSNNKSKKQSAGKKTSTTAKSRSTSSPKVQNSREKETVSKEKYIPSEKDKKIHSEIKLLLSLAVSVLLLLSNFGIISPVGDYISYFMFGITGFMAYILPILIFVGVAFFLSNKDNTKAMIKFAAAIVAFICICGFIQLVMYNDDISFAGYYKYSGSGKKGGGLIGGFVAKCLYSLIGYVGAYIVILLLLIISVVLITEKSFINGVKNGSRKVYSTAKDDVTRIKENAALKAEEKEYNANRRINKKVRGVAITKITDENAQSADIHEITEDINNGSIFRGHVDVEKISQNPISEMDNDIYKAQGYEAFEEKEIPDAGNLYEPEIKDDYGVFHESDNISQTEINDKINTNNQYSLLDNGNQYVTRTVGSAKGYDDAKSEDGEYDYTPKEKIQVSQSAINSMKRKAFDITSKPEFDTDLTNNKNLQQDISSDKSVPVKKNKEYVLPDINLLNRGQSKKQAGADVQLRETANRLKQILENFGVKVTVNNYSKGPSVTRYELQPELGTRLNRITSLADDIKLNLAATDIRIEAPIPGKSAVGIEVPNTTRETVFIRELIESKELAANPSKLAFAAGKDIGGKVVVADIAKMPHMLIAGTTGSGKSVFTNSIIMTILYRAKPSEVRLIIIDPKVVEFGVYNGIPHLLQPVVTDAKLASNTLKWAVNEMSERYKKFAEVNVRDLKGYNEKAEKDGQTEKLPQILIVIDELADLMMVAAKEVEESICRLAQLARAAGIHLIIATQRPSVDVVTGLIKANIPSRTALMVSSGTDSRTIIDSVGAEKLLGNGDMLFYPSGYVKPVRLQGSFVSDQEVQRVVGFWSAQAGEHTYDTSISQYISDIPTNTLTQGDGEEDGRDEYFIDAGRFITDKQKASISGLQRVFKIGFNRAARIIDQLEEAGVIGAEEGTKPRNVLMTKEEFEQFINS